MFKIVLKQLCLLAPFLFEARGKGGGTVLAHLVETGIFFQFFFTELLGTHVMFFAE